MRNFILALFFIGPVAHADLGAEFQTPDQAAAEIAAVSRSFQKKGDPRGLFAGVYALTIQATGEGLKRGRFQNPRWVHDLVVNYANIYRRTLLLELQGQRGQLPLSWQLVFAHGDRRSQWTAELDLVYGINVHIARDLVEALHRTPTDWGSTSVRRDYLAITEILRGTMPAIWNLYDRYAFTIPGFSWIGQNVMMEWIARLRIGAWNNAYISRRYSDSRKRAFLNQLDRSELTRVQNFGLWTPLN